MLWVWVIYNTLHYVLYKNTKPKLFFKRKTWSKNDKPKAVLENILPTVLVLPLEIERNTISNLGPILL